MIKIFFTITLLLVQIDCCLADKVGNVGAVNQLASGHLSNGRTDNLVLGANIENNERIQTGADGTVQVIFLDTSTMTIGRNSNVVVDKFIYANSNENSTQSLSLSRGVLRFIGGGISHSKGAEIKVPTASIGIRGGSVIVRLDRTGKAIIILQYGILDISSSHDKSTISRPGLAVVIEADGSISEPFRVSSAEISSTANQLVSSARQNGGVALPPTDEETTEALSNVPTLNISQANGLAQIGQIWSGNALVQSFANAVNQYDTATHADILNHAINSSFNPNPGPGPGPTPPPTPPTPPTPPVPPPAPPVPPAPVFGQ